MIASERRFGLASAPGTGISCSESGLFVGEVPLLVRDRDLGRSDQWRPRLLFDLNRDLGECYGLPIEFSSKTAGLAAVARSLDRNDLAHAQILALHLRLPDPPTLTKSAPTAAEIVHLARQLQASGLLKAGWDPAKHPRWPAKSPGGVGGEFAPAGGAPGPAFDAPGASLIPVQITIPAPLDIPVPGEIPFPSEILPPPLVAPNIIPREAPTNPYPDRAECVEEWATAKEFCKQLRDRGLLGKGAYRGMGMTFEQCVRGQVSEDCGGNSVGA